ncbi:hypothetical protein [Marinomonas epiphytica]
MKQDVEQKLNGYPESIRQIMLSIRKLIFGVAENCRLGEVEESLKWGQLSYKVSKGTAIRMDWNETTKDKLHFYVHCQTSLIGAFRAMYPEQFDYQGNRELMMTIEGDMPLNCLAHCIELAFTYDRKKQPF